MSWGGLWLAVTITPPTAPSCFTEKASSGVGTGSVKTSALTPRPAKTAAASSAKRRLEWRPSKPITTPRERASAPCGLAHVRGEAPARLDHDQPVHAREARLDLAAQPRGAELERPGEAVVEVAARGLVAALHALQQRLELAARPRIGILGDELPREGE